MFTHQHFVESSPIKFCLFSVIEQLPVELRDRFTDMREMDLQVQSMLYHLQDCGHRWTISFSISNCTIESALKGLFHKY